jgi:hypothetical protein
MAEIIVVSQGLKQRRLELTYLPRIGEHIILEPVSKRKGAKTQAYEVTHIMHSPALAQGGEVAIMVKRVDLEG